MLPPGTSIEDKDMPIHRTTKNGKPAFQYGNGAKYSYTSGNAASRERAKQKAIDQALAIAHRTGKPAHLHQFRG